MPLYCLLHRLKEFMKRQKSAEVRAEKEQKKLMKLNNKTAIASRGHDDQLLLSSAILLGGKNGKLVPSTLISYKSKLARPSPTYSDIVGTATKRQGSAVGRRALARRNDEEFKVVEVSGSEFFKHKTCTIVHAAALTHIL